MAENIIVLGDLVGAPRVVAVDVEVRDMRGYAIHERLIYDVILRVVPCPNRCYFLFRHSEIICLFAYIRDVFIVVEDTPRGVLGGVFEVPSSEVPAEVAIKFHCAVPRLFVRLGGSAGRAPFVRFIVVRVTPNVEFAYQNRHAVVAPFGIPSSLHAQNITAQHVSNSAISAVATFFITNPSIFTKNYSNI